jgi:hypothetical protein
VQVWTLVFAVPPGTAVPILSDRVAAVSLENVGI